MDIIKYVGTVSPYKDDLTGSGLTWTANQQATVSDDVGHAARGYPGLFQLVDELPGAGVNAAGQVIGPNGSPVSGGGGGLVSTTSYASAAALEAAYPAASNSGKQGIVGSTIYYSNGTAWTATGSSGYDTDVSAYAARIVAAGGSIDAATLGALDLWVKVGRQDGWYANLVEVWPFLGTNLAAGRQKLKYASAAALTNNNFVEADFNQLDGIGALGGNSNKWIDTGFTPSDSGISHSSVCVGVEILGNLDENGISSSVGSLAGVLSSVATPSGTNPPIRCMDQVTGIGTTANKSDAVPYGLNIYNATASLTQGWVAWARTRYGGAPTSVPAFAYPISLHAGKLSNDVTYYATAKTGLMFMGTGLTDAQAISLAAACKALTDKVRRFRGPVYLPIGDSITMRTGSGAIENSYVDRVASAIGCPAILMHGQGGARLTADDTAAIPNYSGVYSRRSYSVSEPVQAVSIVIGTNDMGADTDPNGATTNYFNLLTGMIREFKRRGGARVVVGAPPYRSDTGANSSTKQAAYAAAAAAAAKAARVPFADTYRAFIDQPTPGSGLADTVHPNDTGHGWMAPVIVGAYRGKLTRTPSLDFSATTSIAVTVLNAVAGMPVRVVPVSQPSVAGTQFYGVVTANDTVTVTASGNVSAQYFRIEVECGY